LGLIINDVFGFCGSKNPSEQRIKFIFRKLIKLK
jgi:hypothetical protein